MYILTSNTSRVLMGTDNRPVVFDTYSEAVQDRYGSFSNVERAD